MATSFRHSEILGIARREGRVTVDGLAERFEVTVQTIRRDLAELAEGGQLERVHGGAILASGVSNIGYEQRRRLHSDAKARIARACAAEIPDECSVFLNIGTTTEAVARELIHHSNLVVITNNINVANILSVNENCEIVVSGGVVRRSDFGLVGDLAGEAIARFKVDLAVIGCSALDLEGDLLDYDIQEVTVSRRIIAQARETYLVADATKFQRGAPVRIASLKDVSSFFTDGPIPDELRASCRLWDTRVEIV